MATLLLVRHGHTDAAGKRLTGWAAGVHLNETGRQQAEHLIERLGGIRLDAHPVESLDEEVRLLSAPIVQVDARLPPGQAFARRIGVTVPNEE